MHMPFASPIKQVLLRYRGTCHIASLVSPLPGTAMAAICSSSNLFVATFTQHLASHPTSGSFLTAFSPLPSPLIVTSHPGQKGLTPLLALLISIHDALLTTHVLLPSHLSGTLITNSSSSHTHHSELSYFLLQKWSFGYEWH